MGKLIACVFFFLILSTVSAQGFVMNSESDSLIAYASRLNSDSSKIQTLIKGVNTHTIRNDSIGTMRLLSIARELTSSSRNRRFLFPVLFKYSFYYKYLGDYEYSLRYLDSCMEIAFHDENGEQKILTYNARANLYERQKDYSNAIREFILLLQCHPSTDVAIGTASELGALYYFLGDYQNALVNYNLSIYWLDSQVTHQPGTVDDTLQLLGLLLDIGKIDLHLRKWKDATERFTKATWLATQIHKPELAYLAEVSSVQVLKENGHYEKAIERYKALLSEYKPLISRKSILLCYYSLADIYCQNRDPKNALAYAQMALDTADQESNAKTLMLLGRIYMQQNDPAKSRPYLERALQMAKRNEELPLCVEIYESLAAVYDSLGLAKQALDAYRIHMLLNDSLYSKDKSNALIKLSLQQEFDRRHITDSLRQAGTYDLKIQRQQLLTNGGFAGLVLVLLLLFFIYRSYQSEKKYSALLALDKQRQEIQLQRQSNLLTDIAYTQSHHLRGPLTTLLGLTSILNSDDPGDPNNKQVLDDIVAVSHRLDDIVREIVTKENQVSLGKDSTDR